MELIGAGMIIAGIALAVYISDAVQRHGKKDR